MYKRNKMQPEPWKLYVLIDKDSNEHIGRWLCGKDLYEGWYIPSEGKIYSQKELQVVSYIPLDDYDSGHYLAKHYIPRAILDEAFYGHQEVYDFRCTPDILCYM